MLRSKTLVDVSIVRPKKFFMNLAEPITVGIKYHCSMLLNQLMLSKRNDA